MEMPGAVWMVDHRSMRTHHPEALNAVLKREYAAGLDVCMLAEVFETLDDLDAHQEPVIGLFFEPPSIDARIANQAGVFSVLSNPKLAMDDWLQTSDVRTIKLVIPAALKWEIRDKLDHCAVNERVLFPGLDGLSQWLRRYYSPGARSSLQAKP
jgi:hypothetical protein